MYKLPYFESIPLPSEKKEQIQTMVNEVQDHDIFQIINMNESAKQHLWMVVKEIDIKDNIGRLIAAITFFKTINIDEKNTLKLYCQYYDLIMNTNLTIFLPHKRSISTPMLFFIFSTPLLYLLYNYIKNQHSFVRSICLTNFLILFVE